MRKSHNNRDESNYWGDIDKEEKADVEPEKEKGFNDDEAREEVRNNRNNADEFGERNEEKYKKADDEPEKEGGLDDEAADELRKTISKQYPKH